MSDNDRQIKWRLAHPDKSKAASNGWKQRNPEQTKAITDLWRLTHKEHIKEYNMQYQQNHPEWKKEANKRYNQNHKVERYQKHKEWRKQNPEKFHEGARKQIYQRRRELGYIPLNTPFIGCEGHHITKNHIIHIPEKLHESISHNHKNPQSMVVINRKSLLYLMYGGI